MVVMTKAQAQAMNQKFLTMKHELEEAHLDYAGMKAIADSLATQNLRNAESLRKVKETLPEALKEVNREWWARMAFVTWGFLVYTLSNG